MICKHDNAVCICGKGENDYCPIKPQTKEEWLHTLNTEQLAEFLCEVWGGIDEIINIMSEDGEINKKDAFVRWLKEPHTTGGTK